MKFCQSFNMRYFQLHVDLYSASIDISRFLFHKFQGNSVLFSPFSRWELIVQFQYFRDGKPFVPAISIIGAERM